MQKRFHLIVSVGILFMLLLLQFNLKSYLNKPTILVSKQDDAFNINHKIISIFSLGQSRLISSLMWIHTLLESDLDNYKNNDLNSWMYLRFKSISELEPYFLNNYLFGGQYLSVIKDDILGAKDIFERGLVHYPENYWLRFYNGFNYYFELKDTEAALRNYSVIEKHPLTSTVAPYLPTLLAKMRVETGNNDLAYELLLTIYSTTEENHPAKSRQHQVLYDLKKEIDLQCLNSADSNKQDCDRLDFNRKPYIYHEGKYRAQNELNN